jgi:chaperone required for assembly of F1-ATPase
MSWTPAKRFWRGVQVRAAEGGFEVLLDDRPLRTPSRLPVVVPGAALARAIAAEWEAIEGEIRPEALPFTRMTNTAIDRVPVQRAAVVEAILDYADSDLLCYRAEAPAALAFRQSTAWDPWLAWARHAFGAPLFAIVGVMPEPQPPASVEALGRAVEAFDDFALSALGELVTLSGSLVLGLAVAHGALAAEDAWDLSRLDEAWQAEHWGIDAEAEAAAARKAADFLGAAEFLSLLGDKPVKLGKS